MPVAEHPNSNQLGIRLKEVNLKSLAADERFAEKILRDIGTHPKQRNRGRKRTKKLIFSNVSRSFILLFSPPTHISLPLSICAHGVFP